MAMLNYQVDEPIGLEKALSSVIHMCILKTNMDFHQKGVLLYNDVPSGNSFHAS